MEINPLSVPKIPSDTLNKIAIYDMDRTITKTGTYSGFLMHIALALSPWRIIFIMVVPFVMLAYVLRLIDRSRVKEWNQALMIGRSVRRERLTRHLESYADKVMAGNIRKGALDRIAQDRAEGFHLVLATASYRLYVEAIAKRLGFDTVIATDHLSQDLNYVRARIAGENCYDQGKLRMIEAWMARHGIARASAYIRGYSDHVSDCPMLAFADEPYAANPHKPLEKLAAQKGWPQLHWPAR